jgi:hypothetical protein
MKLIFRCIYCSNINYLPYKHTDRGKLRNEFGQVISRNCSKCGEHCIVGINEIKARESKLKGTIFIAGFISGILLSIFVFYRYKDSDFNIAVLVAGSLLVIPILFSIVYSYSEQNSVRLFNRYYV